MSEQADEQEFKMARIRTATRTIHNGAPRQSLMVLCSEKANGKLVAESLIEADGLLCLLFDDDIVQVQVQPERFQIPFDEGNFFYTPDARFVRLDGRIGYREFKADIDKLEADETARYSAAAAYFSRMGFEYQIVDAKELRAGHRLANIKLLRRYAACAPDHALLAWVETLLNDKPSTLGELRERIDFSKIPSLFNLFWEQKVEIDIDSSAISDSSVISRSAK